MDSQILSFLLNKDAFFYGGFVRDYLIRGEKFSDIDYCFYYDYIDPRETILNINNKSINLANLQQRENIYYKKMYHFANRGYYHDLSCNLFGFDKNGFFPLPCQHKNVNMNKAWEGILNKEFYILSRGQLAINNLLMKRWKLAGKTEDDRTQEIISRDRTGIWQTYNEIAFQRIKDIDKI